MGIQAKICRRLVNDENRSGVLECNSSPPRSSRHEFSTVTMNLSPTSS